MPSMDFNWAGTFAYIPSGNTSDILDYGVPKFLAANNYWYAYGANAANLKYVYVRFYPDAPTIGLLPISDASFLISRVRANPDMSFNNFSQYSSGIYNGYYTTTNSSGNPILLQGPNVVDIPSGTYIYDSVEDVFTDPSYPITYRLTNCTAPTAPTEARSGSAVSVVCQFTEGYGVVNPSTDVYVTNNGVVIPSTYSNGTLLFTMP